MAEETTQDHNRYTCAEYREEMMLAGLQRSLNTPGLDQEEKCRLQAQIEELERRMGLL